MFTVMGQVTLLSRVPLPTVFSGAGAHLPEVLEDDSIHTDAPDLFGVEANVHGVRRSSAPLGSESQSPLFSVEQFLCFGCLSKAEEASSQG